MVGVVPDKKNSFSSESSLSSSRVLKDWIGLYGYPYRMAFFIDCLKPVPFMSFDISPPGRACIQEL